MKNIFYLLTICFSMPLFSQVSGDIAKDNRKLISDLAFTFPADKEGVLYFRIAVNPKGEITSAKVIDSESTINSTPIKLEVTNYVKSFQFEEGTWFPKFHQGEIKITVSRQKNDDSL